MPRDLDWDGCVNVRDLGGFATASGETAYGVFVRADNARKLTPAGWRAAREYGIRTVLDLRSDAECAADPPAQEGFAHRRLSLLRHFDDDMDYRTDLLARVRDLDAAARYRTLYHEALELDARQFGAAAGVLADADAGVVFHCVGGKDRTGVLAALVLRLAGVALDAIEDDYVRTETRARAAGGSPEHDVSAPRGVIGAVLAELEARHGGVGAYLVGAGASSEQVERLRARLSE